MAISCNPTLLIADEPTTALDVTVQATILDLLRELRDRRGMSIIFITHDLGIIAEIADSVAVMYQGKIVESRLRLADFFQASASLYQRDACLPSPARAPDEVFAHGDRFYGSGRVSYPGTADSGAIDDSSASAAFQHGD